MTSQRCVCGPLVDLPEDPKYTVLHSITDSVRFVRSVCMTEYNGHASATSTFVDENGEPQLWHEFGPLEGPGWAANAVGGAQELYAFGTFAHDQDLVNLSLSLLEHVLEDGFIDWNTGFIYSYRHTGTDTLVANYQANNDWFCPGSMARIAHQLLELYHQKTYLVLT